MDLLQRILDSNEEDIYAIIEQAITEANDNSNKVKQLGYTGSKLSKPFKGFISLDTEIKYSNLDLVGYRMKTTDYIYEFSHFIKKHNINSTAKLIRALGDFINSYFGIFGSGRKDRSQIYDEFESVAFSTTLTDEELFSKLKDFQLGNFKHKRSSRMY